MDQETGNHKYLEFLCTLGLKGLSDESLRLENTRTNLTDISQELALNYYPSFIATNECIKNLSSDVSAIMSVRDSYTYHHFSCLKSTMKVITCFKTFPNFAT